MILFTGKFIYFVTLNLKIQKFIFSLRIDEIKDENDQVPGDFDNEIHKWALECEFKF